MTIALASWNKLDSVKIDSKKLLEWAYAQTGLIWENYSGKPTSRLEKWWGLGVKLSCFYADVYAAPDIEGDALLCALCGQFYPEANSILLYFYALGATIGVHTENPVFDRRGVAQRFGISVIPAKELVWREGDAILTATLYEDNGKFVWGQDS